MKQNFRSFFKSYLDHRAGAVMVLSAVVIPLLILVVAFSVVTSLALSEQSRLQSATDQAARVASQVRSSFQTLNIAGINTVTTSDYQIIRNAAIAIAKQNGYNDGVNASVIVNVPPTSGQFIYYPTAVEVRIRRTQSTFFGAGILGRDFFGQFARAVGDWDYSPCVVALNTRPSAGGGSTGLTIAGGASLQADCGVYSNSNDLTGSISVTAGAQLNAVVYAMVGNTTSSIYGSGQPFQDPFTYSLDSTVPTAIPTTNISYTTSKSSSCGSVALCYETTTGTGSKKTTTIYKIADANSSATCADCFTTLPATNGTTPIVYDTLKPTSGSTINLEPGKVYYTRCLELTGASGSGSTINGTGGNTIVIVPGGSCGSGPVSVGGGSNLNLSPITDAASPFAGISLIAGYGVSGSAAIRGGANGAGNPGISGIVALPGMDLTITGGGTTSAGCQTFFANSVKISGGNTGIGSGCTARRMNSSSYRGANLSE